MTPTPEMPKADDTGMIEPHASPHGVFAEVRSWIVDPESDLTAIERYAQQQAAEAQQQRERAEKAGADMEEYRKIVREIGDRLGGVESNTKLIVGILNMVTKERDTLADENRQLREELKTYSGCGTSLALRRRLASERKNDAPDQPLASGDDRG